MTKLYTTFALLHEAGACEDGYKLLAKSLGGIRKYGKNTPIDFLDILESNGIDDALWALRAVPKEQEALRDKVARLMACDFAERVLPLYEKEYPNEKAPRNAIVTARRFASGEASRAELAAARDAAWAAARDAAWAAARDAEREIQTEIFTKYMREFAVQMEAA